MRCAADAPCQAVRQLTVHWLKCPAGAPCPTCSCVWAVISSDLEQQQVAGFSTACSGSGVSSNESSDEAMLMLESTESGPSVRPAQVLATLNSTPNDSPQGTPSRQKAAGKQHCSNHDLEVQHVVEFACLLLTAFILKTPGTVAESEAAAANRLHWTSFAKELWLHILQDCDMTPDCTHPGCCNARAVINHMLTCKVGLQCPVCLPVSRHFSRSAPPPTRMISTYLADLALAMGSLQL